MTIFKASSECQRCIIVCGFNKEIHLGDIRGRPKSSAYLTSQLGLDLFSEVTTASRKVGAYFKTDLSSFAFESPRHNLIERKLDKVPTVLSTGIHFAVRSFSITS